MVDRIKKWLYGIKADKLLHFVGGLVIAQVSYKLLALGLSMWLSALLAFAMTAVVGGVKEALDVKYGVPSWKDFIATAIGGIVGLLIIAI